MQPLVTGLILASALLHALWNAALKRQRDPESAAIAIIAVATAIAAAAVPFARRPWFQGGYGLVYVLMAGLGEAGYFATLALALRQAPLNVVYTISRGGSLAAVWPVSLLWLGERVTALTASGAIAVGVGLLLAGLGRSGRASARGVTWAILCALFIAGYHLAYKRALSLGAQPAAVFAAALALTLPINFARLGRGSVARINAALREQPLALLGAGAICATSFLVFLFALAGGGAGAVITLRNTSVVFALLLSWVIGERPDRPQIVGAIAVATGAVLLGWPADARLIENAAIMASVNPYQAPASNASGAAGTPQLPSRAYGVVSIVLGSGMLLLALAFLGWGLLLRTAAEPAPTLPAPNLPAPQANFLAAITNDFLEPPPLMRAIGRTVTAIGTVMPLGLIAVGILQIRWRRRALWPTRIWAGLALLLLATLLGLILAALHGRLYSAQRAARIAGAVFLLGPYPIVLLATFRCRRRAPV